MELVLLATLLLNVPPTTAEIVLVLDVQPDGHLLVSLANVLIKKDA